jgi:hypothetical protein
MADSINAEKFLIVINPVENAIVADAQFTKTGEVVGHSGEPPMNHRLGVFGKPLDLAFDARAYNVSSSASCSSA